MTNIMKNTSSSPLKKEKFLYKHRFVIIAFLIPLILMIYAFFKSDFYPFGSNQIMVIDMWHQYFPFLKVLQTKLQTGGSLLYTWQGGGGSNFIAMISYYAASPLYLLTALVPQKYLTEAMAMIVVLKISFAASFMYIYLREMYKRDDMGIVAFSVLYSLSAYAMGYYWCLMWLDVMALLPLCMLGLNKLIDEGKFKLYSISLALIMISNYYIGVMVCIFIAIYYPVLYFSRKKAKGAKICAITTLKAVLFSLVGCCMAAIILIPTYLSMQNTYYIDQAFPTTNDFYNGILDVITNMFPNVELTVRGGLPNIYCGVLSFMMAVLFLMNKKVSAKKKILNCCILFFLILSFNWNKLDFIWHGFHFPNELPYRYSFVFSFILVSMACEAYQYLKDISPKQIGSVAAGGFIYIILAQKLYSDKFDYSIIYVALAFLAAYSIVLAIYKTGKFKQAACGIMLFVVVFAEMTNYTVQSVRAVGNSNRDTYYTSYDDIEGLIDSVEKTDDSFYRMEVTNNWTCNDPALYGYNGISQFSSELNCKVSAMMEDLGLAADPGSNSFRYHLQTPIASSMLNLKYVIGRAKELDDFSLVKKYFSNDGSTIYLNKYALSIGYMVNNDIKQWSPSTSNCFESQNSFIWNATGISTPSLVPITDFNETASVDSQGASLTYSSNTVMCSSNTAHIVFNAPKEQPIYAWVSSGSEATSITGCIEGHNSVDYEANRGCILALGTAQKGDQISFDVQYNEESGSDITVMVYGLDTEIWNSAYAELSDEMLNVKDYSDTKIEGEITAKNDGILMTSIPYENGWTAYVDGEKVETFGIQDAFLALNLKQGKHTIKFSYIPAGFIMGVAVSIISIIALIALHFAFKRQEEKRRLLSLIEAENPFTTGDDIGDKINDAFNEENPVQLNENEDIII